MIEGMSYIIADLHYHTDELEEMIEVWKPYHVYDPKDIEPTFQREMIRREMYHIQRLRSGDGVREG